MAFRKQQSQAGEERGFAYTDLRKRNLIVTIILTGYYLLMAGLMASYSMGSSYNQKMLIPSGIILALMWGMQVLRRWEGAIAYLSIAMIGYMTITNLQFDKTSVLAALPAFFLLALGAMYNSRPILLYGIASGAGMILVKFVVYPSGSSDDINNFVYYLLYYIIVSGLIVGQSEVGRSILKRVSLFQQEAQQNLERERQRDLVMRESVRTLSTGMEGIRLNGHDNAASFDQMNVAFQEMSSGVNSQAESISDIAGRVSDSTNQLSSMMGTMGEMLGMIEQTRASSVSGSEVMEELNDTIGRFQASLKETKIDFERLNETIRDILPVTASVREVARQTSLLSLNASIEAARAGEHGAGFGIVASEIRKLAVTAGDAAEKITESLDLAATRTEQSAASMQANVQRMDESLELVERTNQAFAGISEAVKQLHEDAYTVGGEMDSVGSSSKEIEQQVETFAAVMQQSSATLEELLATVETLTRQNSQLQERIEQSEDALRRLASES